MSSRHSRIQSPITDPTEHGEKIDFLNADGHFLAFAESISWKLIENLFKWVIWAEHSATSSASIPRERNTPPVTIYFSSKSHNPGVLRIDRRNCIVGYKFLLRGWIPRPVTTEPPLWAGLGWTQQCCARYQPPFAREWSACITSSTILQYIGIYASRYLVF